MIDIEKAIDVLKTIEVDKDDKELEDSINLIIPALEKQLNGGWIPVSERLPTKKEFIKDDGRFIVTDGQRVYQSLYDIYEKQSFVEVYYKGNCNFLSTVDERVIAWQPLPKPYKDKKKENIKSCDTCKKNKTYFDCSQCNDLDEWEER